MDLSVVHCLCRCTILTYRVKVEKYLKFINREKCTLLINRYNGYCDNGRGGGDDSSSFSSDEAVKAVVIVVVVIVVMVVVVGVIVVVVVVVLKQ